jgi:hypothetical protein
MRAVSLHRFLPGQLVARVAAYTLLIWVVFICLLVFGATGVAAAQASPGPELICPFRW